MMDYRIFSSRTQTEDCPQQLTEKEKRRSDKLEEEDNGHVEGVATQVDDAETNNVLKAQAQSGTDIQESRTSPEGPVNESVMAADTQEKVDRPGQAEVLECAYVALNKLEKVEADSKENHNKVNAQTKKRKSQIVQEFAQDLERIGFPTDRIAAEITQQLYKKVSRSLILDCLDEKYKTSYRVENALKRKQKKKCEGLAPVVPELELNPGIVVDTSGNQMVEQAPERSTKTDAEAIKSGFDDEEDRTTNTESKEESTRMPPFNDEITSTIKQNEDLMDTKKVLVSHINMSFEHLRRDMYAVSQRTNGMGDVFWKLSIDLATRVAKIEFCGITQEKDITMISTGKGILKEAN